MRAAFLAVCLAALAACSPREPAPAAPFQARFAVRGRWQGARELRVFVEHEPGPLARAELVAAVQRALATWHAAGACEFALVEEPARANVVLGWRRGTHGECMPFGQDPSVAHAGPAGPGTFVHLDAGRDWSARGLSLEQAALHELGHALGLDHSPDEESVMYPEPRRTPRALGRTDLAALRALYGLGTRPAPGDLEVLRADGTRALLLAEVAPPELCEFACFDSDGDGDDELLVWRVDADPLAGGALWSYHFGAGPTLARTLGPLYGVSAPGARLACVRDEAGGRWLAIELAGQAARFLRFDAHGLPGAVEDGALPPPVLPAAQHGGDLEGGDLEGGDLEGGDLDGDGQRERVQRVP